MYLEDFLLYKTRALELCMIRDGGWNSEAVWIDHEDLFRSQLSKLRKRSVKSDEWGQLTIVTEHGDKINVPVHYIDI